MAVTGTVLAFDKKTDGWNLTQDEHVLQTALELMLEFCWRLLA